MTVPANPTPPASEESTSSPAAAAIPEEDLVPADDRVIGQAFRWSLLGLVALAIVAAGVWLLLRPAREARPTAAIATAPPLATRPVGEPPAVNFRDVTADAGIRFVHYTGAAGGKFLPETMGGGGAFFDLDRDDDADLLLVDGTSWPGSSRGPRRSTVTLYRNLGGFRFEDVTATHGPGLDFYGMGVAVGDYDGDGWTDALITAVGRNRLLRNVEGKLVDVTARAGVGGSDQQWSTCATFLDQDNDGDLDLFVCNYVKWSPQIDLALDYRLTGVGRAYGPPLNYEGAHSQLYRNDGDGTFTDVSTSAGIQVVNPATGVPVGKSLGVLPVDVDRDGWTDLLVANDTVRNFFFRNRGDGSFEETAELWGLAYDRDGNARGAMGVDAGYYRNDEELGFAIGNFANEMSALYVTQGDPTLFVDEAIAEGIGAATRTRLSFGMLLLDYDLDGRLDLLQSNGHLEEEIAQVDPSQSYRQPAQLFWNAGPDAERTFALVSPQGGGDLSRPIVGRGSAYADLDGDGDLDVILLQAGGAPLLLRNEQQLGHHWLRVRLAGEGRNPAGLGARIELRAGGTRQLRRVHPTRSYLSQSELPVTFGLGKATAVESLTVTWPDGSEQVVPVPGVDRLLVVEKGR
jgi:hypothetical protein